jgi:hypothetical protein
MYRAPPGTPPGTWGDLLMWHRHGLTATASWMTHVWLVRHVREAFATCAPMAALEMDRRIRSEPYKADVSEDRACKTERSGGNGSMPGMGMS